MDVTLRTQKFSQKDRTAGCAAEGVVRQTDKLIIILRIRAQAADDTTAPL